MNIFLDTTVFYSDPFLKQNFSRLLLSYAEEGALKIYVSQVVVEESCAKYVINYRNDATKLINSLRAFNHVAQQEIALTVAKETDEKILRSQFEKWQKSEVITVLNYENNILPELVRRAIGRIKPFTEKKQEFRDTIIWLTYANYASQNSSQDCILITGNTTEYLNDKKDAIHEDLQKDSKHFRLYSTLKEFFENEASGIKGSREDALQRWVDEEKIDHDFVEKILGAKISEVQSHIQEYVQGIYPYEIDEYMSDGYVTSQYSAEILSVDNIDYDFFLDEQEVMVMSTATVSDMLDFYEYNGVRDPGEDSHIFRGSDVFSFEVSVTFLVNKERQISDFQIEIQGYARA